jgi:hypothetical protein
METWLGVAISLNFRFETSFKVKKIFWFIAVFLIALGVYVSYEFFTLISVDFTYGDPTKPIKMDATGQVGDFIGGIVGTIFSLAGTILLLLTLTQQSTSHHRDSFESKFFKLIELHRANVDEISIHRFLKNEKEETVIQGRRAFKHVFNDIISCRDEIKEFFEGVEVKDIYTEKYQLTLENYLSKLNRKIDLKELALLNISYCIVFYGVGEEGQAILSSLLNSKFKDDFVNPLISLIRMKPTYGSFYFEAWEELERITPWKSRIAKIRQILEYRSMPSPPMKIYDQGEVYYGNDYVKYYGGNQFWLGHYYRHFFQSIKFVNGEIDLKFKEKYFYVKTFRAQLSTYEQALLLVNSLSFLGMIWELVPESNGEENRLITRYNLIKNLPGEEMAGINYKKFYPDVEYEIDRLMKI